MKYKLFLVLLFFLMPEALSFSAENALPHLKAKPGEIIDIPVIIDKTDNLAGVKLLINYDKELLTFKEGNTTKSTRSLMCVINDKKPGKLIIVMAGAKGVSGKDLPLLNLTFEVRKELPGTHTTRFEILEMQLMSDQLKEVKGSVIIKPLDILP